MIKEQSVKTLRNDIYFHSTLYIHSAACYCTILRVIVIHEHTRPHRTCPVRVGLGCFSPIYTLKKKKNDLRMQGILAVRITLFPMPADCGLRTAAVSRLFCSGCSFVLGGLSFPGVDVSSRRFAFHFAGARARA